jgi:hypothetical protein
LNEQKFDVQSIFNHVLEGQGQKVLFADKKEYDSLRVTLVRKYTNYTALLESLGGPNYLENKFFRAAWNGKEVSGTFTLEEKEERKNLPGRLYRVISL